MAQIVKPARPMKQGDGGRRRLFIRAAALGLALIVAAGCSITGRAIAPTPLPPRLLDPTATSGPPVATAMPLPVLSPAPVERTVQIIGVVESIAGAFWVVDGVRVRVDAAVAPPGIGPGSLVRIVARVTGDDDDENLVAISIEAVLQVTIVGQITALDPTQLTVDGRVIIIPPGFALPDGLLPGVIVRVLVDDDGGKLLLRSITILPEATIIGGTIESIDGEIIVIGGQRLRLAPEVVLWRVRLALGEPVRIIVIPINGTLTIITITIVTIVVPPPVIVMPIPTIVVPPPPPVIVRPAPRPAPPSNSGNSDDDDDDD